MQGHRAKRARTLSAALQSNSDDESELSACEWLVTLNVIAKQRLQSSRRDLDAIDEAVARLARLPAELVHLVVQHVCGLAPRLMPKDADVAHYLRVLCVRPCLGDVFVDPYVFVHADGEAVAQQPLASVFWPVYSLSLCHVIRLAVAAQVAGACGASDVRFALVSCGWQVLGSGSAASESDAAATAALAAYAWPRLAAIVRVYESSLRVSQSRGTLRVSPPPLQFDAARAALDGAPISIAGDLRQFGRLLHRLATLCPIRMVAA